MTTQAQAYQRLTKLEERKERTENSARIASNELEKAQRELGDHYGALWANVKCGDVITLEEPRYQYSQSVAAKRAITTRWLINRLEAYKAENKLGLRARTVRVNKKGEYRWNSQRRVIELQPGEFGRDREMSQRTRQA